MNAQIEQQSCSQAIDIEDVVPMGADDQACLNEVRHVLARYGKLHRFGLYLAHNHFPIGDDEILLESCDSDNRTLNVRVVKRDDIAQADYIETNWSLLTGIAIQACKKKDH